MTEMSDFEKSELKAAEWIIKLSEDPDNQELQTEFDAWYDESDLNAQLYDDTVKAFDVLGESKPITRDQWDEPWIDIKPASLPEPEIVPLSTIPGSSSNGFTLSQLFVHWKLSFAFPVFTIMVVMFLVPIISLNLQADYSTGTAQRKTIVLDDGSQVTLYPESAISVEFNDLERQVRLIQGAAYFDIASNINRPFSVDAGGTKTTVLGTEFSVRLQDNGAVIAVAEGHVRVDDNSTTPIINEELVVGDRLQVTWQDGAERDQVSIDDIVAMREGELVARNMPISELVNILQTYHKGTILIKSSNFEGQMVTGLFNLNDPGRTLDTLANLYGAEISQITPWILLVTDSD